jgi:hypothetical protein
VKGRGWGLKWCQQISRRLILMDTIPRNPSSGASKSGSAISALTPQTTVVSPKRTRDDPSAVDIEPNSKGRLVAEADLYFESIYQC